MYKRKVIIKKYIARCCIVTTLYLSFVVAQEEQKIDTAKFLENIRQTIKKVMSIDLQRRKNRSKTNNQKLKAISRKQIIQKLSTPFVTRPQHQIIKYDTQSVNKKEKEQNKNSIQESRELTASSNSLSSSIKKILHKNPVLMPVKFPELNKFIREIARMQKLKVNKGENNTYPDNQSQTIDDTQQIIEDYEKWYKTIESLVGNALDKIFSHIWMLFCKKDMLHYLSIHCPQFITLASPTICEDGVSYLMQRGTPILPHYKSDDPTLSYISSLSDINPSYIEGKCHKLIIQANQDICKSYLNLEYYTNYCIITIATERSNQIKSKEYLEYGIRMLKSFNIFYKAAMDYIINIYKARSIRGVMDDYSSRDDNNKGAIYSIIWDLSELSIFKLDYITQYLKSYVDQIEKIGSCNYHSLKVLLEKFNYKNFIEKNLSFWTYYTSEHIKTLCINFIPEATCDKITRDVNRIKLFLSLALNDRIILTETKLLPALRNITMFDKELDEIIEKTILAINNIQNGVSDGNICNILLFGINIIKFLNFTKRNDKYIISFDEDSFIKYRDSVISNGDIRKFLSINYIFEHLKESYSNSILNISPAGPDFGSNIYKFINEMLNSPSLIDVSKILRFYTEIKSGLFGYYFFLLSPVNLYTYIKQVSAIECLHLRIKPYFTSTGNSAPDECLLEKDFFSCIKEKISNKTVKDTIDILIKLLSRKLDKNYFNLFDISYIFYNFIKNNVRISEVIDFFSTEDKEYGKCCTKSCVDSGFSLYCNEQICKVSDTFKSKYNDCCDKWKDNFTITVNFETGSSSNKCNGISSSDCRNVCDALASLDDTKRKALNFTLQAQSLNNGVVHLCKSTDTEIDTIINKVSSCCDKEAYKLDIVSACGGTYCPEFSPLCNEKSIDYLKRNNATNHDKLYNVLQDIFLRNYKDIKGMDTIFKETINLLENKKYDEFIENSKRCK